MTDPAEKLEPTPITQLIAQWHATKKMEDSAKKERLRIEKEIEQHQDVMLSDEGITTLDNLKISTGYNRSWDQDRLREISEGINDEFFPFKTEFKEDRKASKVVEDRFPDLWDTIRAALTLKPKKPSFTWKEEKK